MKNIILISCLFLGLSACSAPPVRYLGFIIETKTVAKKSYALFFQKQPNIRLTIEHPSKDNTSILLSVPGTYTSPQNKVEGFLVLDGNIIQNKERQGWNGAAIFKDGSIEIIQTSNGRLLTQEKLREIAREGASLIQAHLLIFHNKAEHFKPQLPYQRRALAVFSDDTIAVVESSTALGLNEFAEDLIKLGVKDAINLDMGAWSEGWYRNPKSGEIITIGSPSESTKRQSNWIVFIVFV